MRQTILIRFLMLTTCLLGGCTDPGVSRYKAGSEGVPGYIVQPSDVRLESEPDRIRIDIPAGTIEGRRIRTEGLVLNLYAITQDALEQALKSAEQNVPNPGQYLGSVHVQADGSSTGEVSPAPIEGSLLVAAIGQEATPRSIAIVDRSHPYPMSVVQRQVDGARVVASLFRNPTVRGILPMGVKSASAHTTVATADGAWIVAGPANSGDGTDGALAKMTSDGQLVPSFGQGGVAVVDLGTDEDVLLDAIVLDSAKIIVAGGSRNSAGSSLSLARLDSNGSLDSDFGTNGVARVTVPNVDRAWIEKVRPLSDGRLLAAGTVRSTSGSGYDLVLALFQGDGTLDPSFGTGGVVTRDLHGSTDWVHDVVIRNDDRILVVGKTVQGAQQSNWMVLRYLATGVSDNSFGEAGLLEIDFAAGPDSANTIALLSDGKFLVGGGTTQTGYQATVGRFLENGSVDPSFGAEGFVIAGTAPSAIARLLVDSERILAVGYAEFPFTHRDFAIWTVNPEGKASETPSFNDFFGLNDRANDAVLLPSGEILVVGETRVDHSQMGWARMRVP